jgi:hypothetical protein
VVAILPSSSIVTSAMALDDTLAPAALEMAFFDC